MTEPTKAFRCPFCRSKTVHPRDVREKYCPACHVFVTDILEALQTQRRTSPVTGLHVVLTAKLLPFVFNPLIHGTPYYLCLGMDPRACQTVEIERELLDRAIKLIENATNA